MNKWYTLPKKKKKECSKYCLREMLRTYFYVIDISFEKMQFTCIWVNLRRFKMIITSG